MRPLIFSLILLSSSVLAQSAPSPSTPSLDVRSMDKSVDPCVDFYQYSCGGWKKNNPIPADQVSWSVYGKLYQDNLTVLRGILEQASSPTRSGADPVTRKIGDFYAACMDEGSVERRGVSALDSDLAAIANLKSVHDLAPLVAHLRMTLGGAILFSSGSRQDPDDSDQQIAALNQGGLGLPDRDYYVKDDAKSKETRQRYLQHLQKVFELLGDKSDVAADNASVVLRIETALAGASMTRVDRRDPYKQKNKLKLADLEQLAPNFDWKSYMGALSLRSPDLINVVPPGFFKELNTQLAALPLANWKTYLRFHLANGYSSYLSSAFVQENFEFYSKYLRGAKELQPRWRRCVQYRDRNLGEALGQAYVSQVFSPEQKASTQEMVTLIEKAMQQRIQALDWMSDETKQQSLAKLHSIRNKIGYPEKWRDYSSLEVARGDLLGNMARAAAFESRRDFSKIGQPVDHAEWGMTPPTVNAYYSAQKNDINFPAGVLQPPLYDAKSDDAPNYGDTGGTIGHELTHGFDDEGSKFDGKGNLKDWWTKEDRQKFDERTKCVSDQYARYVVVDDIHINSKLTLGEDVADLGGEYLAYMAWKDAVKGKALQPIEGLTPDQRFFVGFAQWDCANERPENQRVGALTDPHSPPKARINGVVVNMPEFAQAFSCKQGEPMLKPADQVCKVW
jgi:putative endopeptidase